MMWRILKFCMRNVWFCSCSFPSYVTTQVNKSRGTQEIDRLSELPDDILVSILSSLKMKEAARTSILSHRWKDLWRYNPVLDFEDSTTKQKNKPSDKTRSDFVSRVNQVLEGHLGAVIDELRISFDLDNSYKSQIDKWVVSAFHKNVKRLMLNLAPNVHIGCDNYTLTCECCMPHNVASIKHSLTSLCLEGVDVSADCMECLLLSCPFLENLSIAESNRLTNIQVSCLSLQLKHLEISDCCSIKMIDISAPKLLSFVYFGAPVNLQIRSASLLYKVSIGARGSVDITPMFDSLAEYFSQLEYLVLDMSLYDELNSEPHRVPQLTNLKHLDFFD